MPIDAPASLRRNRRRGVVEVLVFCFEKTVVDFVEKIAKELLRRGGTGTGIGPEDDSILILIEKEFARHVRG